MEIIFDDTVGRQSNWRTDNESVPLTDLDGLQALMIGRLFKTPLLSQTVHDAIRRSRLLDENIRTDNKKVDTKMHQRFSTQSY